MVEALLRRVMAELADEIMAERLRDALQECGSVLNVDITGKHYELVTNNTHSGVFYHLKRGLQFKSICELCVFILCRKLSKLNILKSVNVVAGPRRGAGPLIHTLSFFLSGDNIRTILMDPDNDHDGRKIFSPEEHAVLLPDDRVLIVDDAFSTGSTVRLCVEGLDRHMKRQEDGGDIHFAGVASAVNRAPESWKPELFMPAVPIAWAIRDPLKTYPPLFCPLCVKGIPVVKVS